MDLSSAVGTKNGLDFLIANDGSSVLDFDGTVGGNNTFTFVGASGALALSTVTAATFSDTIVGLNVGPGPTNFIDFLNAPGVTVTSGGTGSGTSGTVQFSNGTMLSLSGIIGATSSWTVVTQSDGAGGTEAFVACFLRGTMIETPDGAMPVEDMAIGDYVLTLSGEARPIKWIGRRSYAGRFAANRTVQPILIRAGALDDDVPRRDLYVSPQHALLIDDVLAPAEKLVNGASIVRCARMELVEYFHIELETHDVLLAEGAPAESFADCDNRAMFHNAADFCTLYPADSGPVWAFCAPRVDAGDDLARIRWELEQRLVSLGHATTFDPDLRLLVDGAELAAESVQGCHHQFRLLRQPGNVRLLSRSSVPAEVKDLSTDARRLGVNLSQLVLSSDDATFVVGHRHPSLTEGFHEAESTHRWTDGSARIPSELFAVFPNGLTIEVRLLDHSLPYRCSLGREARMIAKGPEADLDSDASRGKWPRTSDAAGRSS